MLSVGDLVLIIDFDFRAATKHKLMLAMLLRCSHDQKKAHVLTTAGVREVLLSTMMVAKTLQPVKSGVAPETWADLLQHSIEEGFMTYENLAAVRR